MAQGIITTQKVRVCSFTGDPGCLGYPAWIDHPECDCIYDEVDFQFCDCGGSDVYGEMWHEEDCPAAEHSVQRTLFPACANCEYNPCDLENNWDYCPAPERR